MADPFKFELVSPEQLLVSEDVAEVVVPAREGYMTILAKHAPVMSVLKPGIVEVGKADGKTEKFVVFGGFLDVSPDLCTLLAESATHVDDINREDVEKRIQEAREDVDDAKDDDSRARAEDYLGQLTTLHGAILPA